MKILVKQILNLVLTRVTSIFHNFLILISYSRKKNQIMRFLPVSQNFSNFMYILYVWFYEIMYAHTYMSAHVRSVVSELW